MDSHNWESQRILPVLPKPLRCGERGYSDMVKHFCSPPVRGLDSTCTSLHCPLYGSRDQHQLQHFRSLYNQFPANILGGETLVKEDVSPSWYPSDPNGPPSWYPLEVSRSAIWNRLDSCYQCCSPKPYVEMGNFPSIDKDGIGHSTDDDCPAGIVDERTIVSRIVRPLRNSMLSQSANTALCTSGERVFKCDHPECPKSFTRKEELTRHKRTHSNERAFECKICSRKFIRKDHMTKHLATHEDVSKRRRYLCKEPGCCRRYTRSDALSRHRAAAHPEHRPLGNFDISQ